MRRILMFVLLEGYAVFLARMQGVNGVRTDEAKYLLNIPYPHPPLVRWIISQTEWMMYQEMFWRIIFATVLVQGVWVVTRMCHPERSRRIVLGSSWLLSAALWIEGGKIMMASLTAIQGLIFIYFFLKTSETKSSLWIGLLWLASLFTAYQTVLFLPIVLVIFWRMNIPTFQKIVYVGGPLILIGLYTFANPLTIVSMISVGGQQVSVPLIDRLGGIIHLWMIGGSILVSILGVLGMLRAKSIPLISSFALVCIYIFVAHREYYSVLFLPLLVGGISYLLKEDKIPMYPFVGLMVILWLVFVGQYPLVPLPNIARQMMPNVLHVLGAGDILISGSFGHEWQYESRVPLRRYRPELLSTAQAAVCISPCAEIEWRGWKKLMADPIPVYVPTL